MKPCADKLKATEWNKGDLGKRKDGGGEINPPDINYLWQGICIPKKIWNFNA
jgi:hypothetical protein